MFPTMETTINHLPNEIIAQIFSCLADTPAPSSLNAILEPTLDLTSSKDCHLKAASLTSQLWRRLALPFLFRHTTLAISPDEVVVDSPLKRELVHEFNMQDVRSFTDFLLTMPVDVPLSKYVQSFVLRVCPSPSQASVFCHFEPIWETIFKTIDPSLITIVAPVGVLQWTISCEIFSSPLTDRRTKLHMLSLQRKPAKALSLTADVSEASPEIATRSSEFTSILLERSWTHLTLNEGSFQEHDYGFLPQPVLFGLLRDRLFPPTVVDFSYYGFHARPQHFRFLVAHLPPVRRFYCQILPSNISLAANKPFDPKVDKIWRHRNTSYSHLMSQMLGSVSGNYKYLEEFESGDMTHEAAFSLVAEQAIRFKKGWRIERDGVLVRDSTTEKSESGDGSEGDDSDDEDPANGAPSVFQGSLKRWAWKGTSTLPVSPLELYVWQN